MQEGLGTMLYHRLKGDRAIWLIVALLTVLSLLAVYSATGSWAYVKKGGNTEYFLVKQFTLIASGLFLMWVCYRIHYTRYSRLAPVLLVFAIGMLLYTQLFGIEINQAKRWIGIPFTSITFQTSDFAKLALIIFVARSIAKKQDKIKDFNGAFLPIILPIVLVCGLIAPSDLSTAILLFATSFMMMFIGRIDMKYLVFLVMMGMVAFGLLFLVGKLFLPDAIRVDTWEVRVKDFMENKEGSHQIQQAKIAIANGEWFGKGPGQSTQRNFLPAAFSDCIYAVICEEYGLIGGFVVLILYLWLLFRTIAIVTKSPKTFGAMLAVGLGMNIVIQAFANLAVSVHLVPVTGLTLPLVSWGGTSILFTSMTIGIILSVSKYIEQQDKSAPVEAA